jgi:hypothetical protein
MPSGGGAGVGDLALTLGELGAEAGEVTWVAAEIRVGHHFFVETLPPALRMSPTPPGRISRRSPRPRLVRLTSSAICGTDLASSAAR